MWPAREKRELVGAGCEKKEKCEIRREKRGAEYERENVVFVDSGIPHQTGNMERMRVHHIWKE